MMVYVKFLSHIAQETTSQKTPSPLLVLFLMSQASYKVPLGILNSTFIKAVKSDL